MFCTWTLLKTNWTEHHGPLLNQNLRTKSRIISRRIPCLATDPTRGVSDRLWTSCLLCGDTLLDYVSKRQLLCTFYMMERFFFSFAFINGFIHNQRFAYNYSSQISFLYCHILLTLFSLKICKKHSDRNNRLSFHRFKNTKLFSIYHSCRDKTNSSSEYVLLINCYTTHTMNETKWLSEWRLTICLPSRRLIVNEKKQNKYVTMDYPINCIANVPLIW